MPKKTGRATSHQNSNSMDLGSGGLALGVGDQRRHGRLLLHGAPQPPELAALAPPRGNPGEQADHDAGHEREQQHEDERRLPHLAGQPEHFDLLRILQREPDEDRDDEEAEDPDEGLHWAAFGAAIIVTCGPSLSWTWAWPTRWSRGSASSAATTPRRWLRSCFASASAPISRCRATTRGWASPPRGRTGANTSPRGNGPT